MQKIRCVQCKTRLLVIIHHLVVEVCVSALRMVDVLYGRLGMNIQLTCYHVRYVKAPMLSSF